MPAQRRPINLLPLSEFETSFGGRFLKWAVTWGRYIVILTELVVIAVFLSRFKLDRDLSLLGEEIEGKKNILEAQSATEEEFRRIQARVGVIKNLIATQLNVEKRMENLSKRIVPGVKLTEVFLTKEKSEISGIALGEEAVGETIARLRGGGVKKVELVEISLSPQGGVKFSLKLEGLEP